MSAANVELERLRAERDALIDEVRTLQGDLEEFGEAQKAWLQFRRERDALMAELAAIRTLITEDYGADYDDEDVPAAVERLMRHLGEHEANVLRLRQSKNEALERAQVERDALKIVAKEAADHMLKIAAWGIHDSKLPGLRTIALAIRAVAAGETTVDEMRATVERIFHASEASGGESCCDMHNVHCEPPGDLCCYGCTEAGHPEHPHGARCVLDAPSGPQ